MPNASVSVVKESVNLFATIMRSVFDNDPEVLLGTAQDLIVRIMSRMLLELHDDKERELVGALYDSLRTKATFHQRVKVTAAEPRIGVGDTDPHLAFAEAWVAYVVAKQTVRMGRVDLKEEVDAIIFSCCHQLAQWQKAGYDLDWHPLDDGKQSADQSGPAGNYTPSA